MTSATAGGREVQILVVDGNPVTRNLVRRALHGAGFAVLEARDGREAFEAVASSVPDLILQDIVLPDFDGYDFLSQLRSNPRIESVPVIAYAGMLSPLEYGRMSSVGFTDVLQKPVDPVSLLHVVETHLPRTIDAPEIGRQRRLLVVDDDPVQLKLARFLLTGMGFDVATANGGSEALARLRLGGIDAVLSDVLMPQPDGFRFCDEIRNDPALAHLPVILLSSNFVDTGDREVARRVGASAMIERTPRLLEAVEALDRAMQQPVQPASVGIELTDYSTRMLRQLDRQVGLNQAAARRAAMHAAILTVIGGISQTLTRGKTLDEALPVVLGDLLAASNQSRGALWMPRAAATGFVVATSADLTPDVLARLDEHGRPGGAIARAAEAGAPLVLGTGTSEVEGLLAEVGGASGLVVPFVVERECLGVLLLVSRSRVLLEPDWAGFARSMATQIGQAFALSQAMTKLVDSEARYRRILETTNDGVWVTDQHGRTSLLNQRMADMLGRRSDDVIGHLPQEFFDADGIRAFDAHAVQHRAGQAAQSELGLVRPDGRALSAVVRSRPIHDAEGQREGTLVWVTDVTARREADRANASLQAQLQQSQKMDAVGRLAGGVAHDFNNILSVILSYSEMMLDEVPSDAAMHEDLSQISRAGRRAAELTRQLLMFSRQQVLEPQILDFNERLTELDKMLRRVLGADVELALLPGAVGLIHADPGGIEQVVMNLVVNARDAMPTGGTLTIETRDVILDASHSGAVPGAYVMIAVTDTGTGMDAATQARIFEPFFTTKPVGKGTGLGLSTAFGIVDQLHGSIAVDSAPGRGTRVAVYLPRVHGTPARDSVAEPDPASLRGTETILVVEDDDQVRAVARTILSKHGYAVLEARNAQEALAIAQSGSAIDLLLSDVVMPHMSGPELARRLAPGRPRMRILCMSGNIDDSIVRHGVVESGFAFLQKPITAATLTRKVRDILDHHDPS